MKKLLFILVIGLVISCNKSITVESDGITKSGDLEFTIITVDGCQYLSSSVRRTVLFTHKGDCTNPIHAPIVMYSDTTLASQHNTLK